MRKIMTALFLLAVVAAGVAVHTKGANGRYYNHGAYRGMPNRMTRMSAAPGTSFTAEQFGVIALKHR